MAFVFCTSSQHEAKVKEVVDGDTIELASGERVRYIGINAPESEYPEKPVEPFGQEATEANRRLVAGRTVRLEFDVQRKDRYGRLLAYVYVDSLFVNAELVKRGYAYAYTWPPNVKHADLFVRLQQEARKAGRGLWRAKPLTQAIDHHEAQEYIGQYMTVKGKVLSTYDSGKAVYLNFGPDYRTDFTVVIFRAYLPNFTVQGVDPVSSYRGKAIKATGTIREYNGPEVIIRDPSQIEVMR